MTTLRDDNLVQMAKISFNCFKCNRLLGKNYCRDCDEFYNIGHADDCMHLKWADGSHIGHRSY